jgi:hypothetical protein
MVKGFDALVVIRKIAPFFSGWDETFIWSCLQGCMGYAIVDDKEEPAAAQLVVGISASLPEHRTAACIAWQLLDYGPRNETGGRTSRDRIWK